MGEDTTQQKHPGGRPTDYSPEILEKTLEYCRIYQELGEVIPTIEGLSCHIKIARSTIYDWKGQEGKKEFSDIIESLMSLQGKGLINQSLLGKFNATIAKVLLTKHGYREGTDNYNANLSDNSMTEDEKNNLKELLGI